MSKTYDVAAYVWPAYSGRDKRARIFWEEGYGEWQTVRKATAKYPGHQWPRRPLWGYVDEADPYVMEMQIDAAADHGVNVFIYDWYWYDGMPFLEDCLNNGYLKARNNDRVKFYLMWANHGVNTIWDLRNSHLQDTLLWRGSVERGEFERIGHRLIREYFRHPSYYTLDGKPVFAVYSLRELMDGLGGADGARDALAWLRRQAVEAGLPGLHLQAIIYGEQRYNLTGFDNGEIGDTAEVVKRIGFDSVTHYQFCHIVPDLDREYPEIVQDACREWERVGKVHGVPYFPHISVGWDANPRYKELKPGIVRNNTPAHFRDALELARRYADAHPRQAPLVTINSWNEWTETSYLEPDDLHGYGYLEAVKSVFHSANRRLPSSRSRDSLCEG